jgi:hypothetical protein
LCAFITVSIEFAINSLLGSENNIPSCPIAIPSSTPIVLNSNGTQPFALISSFMIADTLSKKKCPGINSIKELATPINGLSKSSALSPVAHNKDL